MIHSSSKSSRLFWGKIGNPSSQPLISGRQATGSSARIVFKESVVSNQTVSKQAVSKQAVSKQTVSKQAAIDGNCKFLGSRDLFS